jgi:hypothetical protein
MTLRPARTRNTRPIAAARTAPRLVTLSTAAWAHESESLDVTGAIFADTNGNAAIGFAADGFPVHGSYFKDATGKLRKARSGYSLKTGSQPSSAGDPGGIYDGVYIDDYEFTGSGDLDACNGVTVDSRNAYCITDSYPWGIKCFSGVPGPSFAKGRP